VQHWDITKMRFYYYKSEIEQITIYFFIVLLTGQFYI